MEFLDQSARNIVRFYLQAIPCTSISLFFISARSWVLKDKADETADGSYLALIRPSDSSGIPASARGPVSPEEAVEAIASL